MRLQRAGCRVLKMGVRTNNKRRRTRVGDCLSATWTLAGGAARGTKTWGREGEDDSVIGGGTLCFFSL